MNKIGLTHNMEFDLELNSTEFKKRIEALDYNSNIFQSTFKKRQLGLMLKQLNFISQKEFVIKKTGDSLNPFRSGRGTIQGQITENNPKKSLLKIQLKSNYKELYFHILTLVFIILILSFGNSDTKYSMVFGMSAFMIFTLILQFIFLKLNINNLKNEFNEIVDKIK